MSYSTVFDGIVSILRADADTKVFAIRTEIGGRNVNDTQYRSGLIEVEPDPNGAVIDEQYQAEGCIRCKYQFLARFTRRAKDRADARKLVIGMGESFKDALGKAGTNLGLTAVIHKSLRFEPVILKANQEELEAEFNTVVGEMRFSCKVYEAPANR